jgi:hypothetical protein
MPATFGHRRIALQLLAAAAVVGGAAVLASAAAGNAQAQVKAGGPGQQMRPLAVRASPTLAGSPSATTSPSPASHKAPSPTPSPGPDAGPQPSPSPTGGQPGCEFFNVTCHVSQAITGWFKDLVTSAINPVFGMPGTSLLATPQLDQTGQVRGLWMGSLMAANACFVLLVLTGGFTLMGYQTIQTSYAVKDIAPRMVRRQGPLLGAGTQDFDRHGHRPSLLIHITGEVEGAVVRLAVGHQVPPSSPTDMETVRLGRSRSSPCTIRGPLIKSEQAAQTFSRRK